MFEAEAFDPWSLAGTATAILLLAAAVSMRPALDAMRLDLAQTLHDERARHRHPQRYTDTDTDNDTNTDTDNDTFDLTFDL